MFVFGKIARVREERREGKERKEQNRKDISPLRKIGTARERIFFFCDFVPFGLFEFFWGIFWDFLDFFFVVLVVRWMYE